MFLDISCEVRDMSCFNMQLISKQMKSFLYLLVSAFMSIAEEKVMISFHGVEYNK